MVVQHNMQAMNANRMLNITTTQQSKSTEKLSSGYRINRAADDAAGLTISEKMRKQIRGLDQASTNAQDGVSAVQTAEGALTEVHSMLQRMNELADQAANGTNSESDREAIQAEIDQLTTEIDRVAETTKFNESYLLKGDNSNIKNEYMKGHDAGLKGKLTDKDETAKFEMDVLKTGDSIMIGGKNYTIAETATDAQKNITDALDTATDAKKVTVTIDDEEYTFDGTTVTDKDGNALYKQADGSLSIATAGATAASKADVAALVKDGSTYKIGNNAAVDVMIDNGEGVDKNNSSIITDDKAYKLVQEALTQANNIGTVDSKATVVAGKIEESTASKIAANLYDADGKEIATDEDLKKILDAGEKVYTDTPVFAAGSAAVGTAGTNTKAEVAATMDTPTSVSQETAQNEFLNKLNTVGVTITTGNTPAWDATTTITMDGYKFTYAGNTGDYKVETADGMDLGKITLAGNAATGTDTGVKSGTVTAGTHTGLTQEGVKGTDYNYAPGDPSKISFDISKGYATVADTLNLNLHVGADADMTNKINVGIDTMNSSFLGVKGLDVVGTGDDGGAAATYAIDAISDAIAKVSAQRSSLGAIQNRLEHTIANVDNVVENTTSAESRIRDTDMAEEMVEYSKNNILAQAGQSMLAQANQANQGVLSLLG